MKSNRHFLLHLAFALILGIAGLIFSYKIYPSCSWLYSFAYYPVDKVKGEWVELGFIAECIRISLLTLFMIILFWSRKDGNIEDQSLSNESFSECASTFFCGRGVYSNFIKKGGWNIFWTLLALIGLFLYHFYLGPLAMYTDTIKTFEGSTMLNFPHFLNFTEYFRPYLFYFLYSFSGYMLIAIPTFVIIRDAQRLDRDIIQKEFKKVRKMLLDSEAQTSNLKLLTSLATEFRVFVNTFCTRFGKYVFFSSILIIYWTAEFSLNIQWSLAIWAQELMKIVIWIFAIAVPSLVWCYLNKINNIRRAILNRLYEAIRNPDTDQPAGGKNDLENEISRLEKLTSFEILIKRIKAQSLVFGIVISLAIGSASHLSKTNVINMRPVIQHFVPYPVSSLIVIAIQLNQSSPEAKDGTDLEDNSIKRSKNPFLQFGACKAYPPDTVLYENLLCKTCCLKNE